MSEKQPVDVLMDRVEWRETGAVDDGSDLPYATHEGVLRIGGITLRVAQLSDGQRVINAEDIDLLFGGDPIPPVTHEGER